MKYGSTDRDYMDDQTSRREMKEKMSLDTTLLESCNSVIARMITFVAKRFISFFSFFSFPQLTPPLPLTPLPFHSYTLVFPPFSCSIVNTLRYDFFFVVTAVTTRTAYTFLTTDSLWHVVPHQIQVIVYTYNIAWKEKHKRAYIDIHNSNDKHISPTNHLLHSMINNYSPIKETDIEIKEAISNQQKKTKKKEKKKTTADINDR